MAEQRIGGGHVPLCESSTLVVGMHELTRCLTVACDEAVDGTHRLYIAAYELTHLPFLELLKRKIEQGVLVRIVFDQKENKDTTEEARASWALLLAVLFAESFCWSQKALERCNFPQNCLIARRSGTSAISHNKFIVFCDGGIAQSVWTGRCSALCLFVCLKEDIGL
jgi:hypothetical protein